MQVETHFPFVVSPYKFYVIGQTKTQVLEIGSSNLSSPPTEVQFAIQV